MKWKLPPRIKIYEALGAIGDRRIELRGNTAKVFSSARNKSYDVTYDPTKHVISANDNGSFWQGYLGYPAVSFLLLHGEIAFDQTVARWLSGIAWKEINTKFHNDFAKTEQWVRDLVVNKYGDVLMQLDTEIARIETELASLQLDKPSTRMRPPKE
jgi:hypothetical protein